MPRGRPASPIGALSEFQLHLQPWLSANAHPGRQQVMARLWVPALHKGSWPSPTVVGICKEN